ncbi:proline-rich protein 22 [Dromaius novaehollandiae]|uniref:proline-rich protein 22 n=1 Tax=Dromaius novaehollandiae TaxID=8790 RepID=UPI00311D7D0F
MRASPPQVGADPGTARGRGGLFPAAPTGLFSRSLPAGSPSLYQPPGQEKEVLAAPPAGLQMAPCGCFFDPRIYHIEWATTSFLQPPVYKLGGGAAPPGTFLLDAQRYLHAAGPPDPFAPYQQLPGPPRYAAPYALPEDGVAPAVAFPGDNAGGRHAAPLLLALPAPGLAEPPLHGYSHVEGRLKPVGDPAAGLPAAPAPAEVPRAPRPRAQSADGSPEPAGCSPPSRQPADLPEQVLLEDAMKLFDCSLAAELSPEELSGILTRGGRPDADGFFLREDAARDIGSLWLPEELLSSDYSVPETLNTVLSMDCFYAVKVAPEEPGWDAVPEQRPPPDGTVQPDGGRERQQQTEGNGWSPKIDTARSSRPGKQD